MKSLDNIIPGKNKYAPLLSLFLVVPYSMNSRLVLVLTLSLSVVMAWRRPDPSNSATTWALDRAKFLPSALSSTESNGAT